MAAFTIKIIACITMVLDHIKYTLPITDCYITEYFGRISFPLFAFLITQGYIHTSNLKKYIKRILIFAIISQIPFTIFRYIISGNYKILNIMFTFLLGILAMVVYDNCKNKFLSIFIPFLIICLGEIIKVDYRWWGVATVFAFYVFRKNKISLAISYIILVFAYYLLTFGNRIINLIIIRRVIYTLVPLIFILLYNGKQGKKLKYFFYVFYPLHLLILDIIYFVCFICFN